MTKETPPGGSPDQSTLRRASLKVAVRISAACAYLDSRDLLEAMIIAGLAGIALAGLVGWLSARSAIRPLGEALALQRRFVQDASHELRTPLAILDTRIQLAQRDAA